MRARTLLVSLFALAACRRSPPPEPRVVAGSGSAIVPESSARPAASAASTVASIDPLDIGTADAAPAECADSNECGADAICCKTAHALPFKADPMMPFRDIEYEYRAVCTTSPEKDCDTLELCNGSSCRRPRPKAQLRCGGITCTDPTPRCVLDLGLERAPGEKARPPRCIGDDRAAKAAMPSSSSVFSCAKSEDCPRGAHCAVRYHAFGMSTIDTECAYRPLRPAHGLKTAPMCREPSECAKLIEGYGPAPYYPGPSPCRPLRGAPSTMRACEVGGNDELF